MRVLFTVSPGVGHLFPTIPLAWALRAAGHEVLVATAAEGVPAAVRAGLVAVATAPDETIDAIFAGPLGTPADRRRRMRERGRQIAGAGSRTHDLLLRTFGQVSAAMADETVRLARWWRPDLVVHSRLEGTGLLVARMLGVPAVEHGFNLLREDDFGTRFLPHLAESFERHRVPVELPDRAVIHVAPPELMSGTGTGWPMRYVPYNAGGLLPDWLWRPPVRPRVLVTLGTVVPRLAGVDGLRGLLGAAARVDAEFVLALGEGADLAPLSPLPANVRPVGWTPLQPLLAGCVAVVHHGGSGTMMTSLSTGVPQLVLPHGADQFVNAELVARHGVGWQAEPEEVSAALLHAVLHDGLVRATAEATARRMGELPAPVELVAPLVDLVR